MIKVFCCFYNEAALIPFFLSHYHFVATIEAFVSPSIDATRELLAADPRVILRDVVMPDGMDDDLKVGWINEALGKPDDQHAWQFVVDADELIWPPDDPTGCSAQSYLESVPSGEVVLEARLRQIYRHEDDADLDHTVTPAVLQRRHGYFFGMKPIVIRSNHGFEFIPGNHQVYRGRVAQPASRTHYFDGAHWQNADPSFAVTRRVRDRKERMSKTNRARGHGVHHYTNTEADVRAELESHRHDAQQF